MPEDIPLRKLGVEFFGNILRQEKAEAIETLAKIETRSAQILAQMQ